MVDPALFKLKLCIFLGVGCLLCPAFSAAGDLREVIDYRASIVLPMQFEYPQKFTGLLHDNTLYLYLDQVRQDAVDFCVVNLESRTAELVPGRFESAPGADEDNVVVTYMADMAMCNNQLFLLSANEVVIVFDVDAESGIRFNRSMPVRRPFNSIAAAGENILASFIYDYHPKTSTVKKLVQLLSPDDLSPIGEFTPAFYPIELSLFKPNHWVDVHSTKIAVANAATYDIAVLDLEFQPRHRITRRPPYWRQIDTTELLNKTTGIPPEEVRAKINVITPMVDAASMLSSVRFLAPDLLSVEVIDGRDESGLLRVLHDFWKFDGKEWILFKSDLQRTAYAANDGGLIDSASFPIKDYRNMRFSNQEYFLTLRYGSGESPIGCTAAHFQEREDSLLSVNSPRLIVDVFTWKWSNAAK